MSHKKKADEILRLLTLCPFEMTEAQAIITNHLTTPDWEKMMTHIWKKRQEAMERWLSEAEWWEALFEVCMGSSHHSQGDFLAAIGLYRSGMPRFKNQGLDYCHGVALIALGQAHQALHAPAEALCFYSEAREVAQNIHRNCPARTRCKGGACRKLSQAIASRIHEVEEPNKLHFIPLPLYKGVVAGMPVYMPGDGAGGVEEEVILEETGYRLLALETREPSPKRFPEDERYFSVVVEGDSMVEAGVRDGDILLVEKYEGEPPQRSIAVFVKEDSKPTVKRFVRSGAKIYLESANPDYPPQVFEDGSPTLRTIGIVVAILEAIK